MRYKVFYRSTHTTYKTISRASDSMLLRDGDVFIKSDGDQAASRAGVFTHIKDGIYYRKQYNLYCIPESHPYFNYDLLEYSIKSIPLSKDKIELFRLFKQVSLAFYKYIISITPRVNTKY